MGEIKQAREKIEEIKQSRKEIEDKVEDIVRSVYRDVNDEDLIQHVLTDNVVLSEFDCYYPIVDPFHENCYNLGTTDYAIRMLNVFVNMCQGGVEPKAVIDVIRVHCADQPAMQDELTDGSVEQPQLFSMQYVYGFVSAIFR